MGSKSKKESIIKLILIVFFVIFFSFLFWYFYKPSESGSFTDKIENDFNLFPFSSLIPKQDKKQEEKKEEKKEEEKKIEEEKIPRLRQISREPTAGVYFNLLNKEELKKYNKKLDRNKKVSSADNISEIRYILSKNGHIYETYTNTLKENRISNITIPKIYQTLFFDKNNILVRYLDNKNTIKTYSIKLADKTEEELQIEEEQKEDGTVDPYLKNFNGLFLPNDILEISISPDKNWIFYLIKNNKKTTAFKSKRWGEEKKMIDNFDFSEWNIDWVKDRKVLFTTKPSKKTHSLSMVYDFDKHHFLKVNKTLLAGNTLANNNFSKILYSGLYGDNYTLFVYDLTTKKKTFLNKKTFVEKCVWSRNNIDLYCAIPSQRLDKEQPDSWYRGYNYFKDTIYRINTKDGTSEIIYSKSINDPIFDMINLKLDDSENYIYWIDKRTNTAWSWQIYESFQDDLKELDDLKNTLDQLENTDKIDKKLGGGERCPSDQIITQNMKAGDRNGKYSFWQKDKITEAKKLQAHMNRLGFDAGEEDGILGPETDGAIKRMQKFLGTYQDGKVGPITRELINNSCDKK